MRRDCSPTVKNGTDGSDPTFLNPQIPEVRRTDDRRAPMRVRMTGSLRSPDQSRDPGPLQREGTSGPTHGKIPIRDRSPYRPHWGVVLQCRVWTNPSRSVP